MLSSGRRNTARSDRVKIDGEPDAVENVLIPRRVFGPHNDVVGRTGEESRVHRVQGHVDPWCLPTITDCGSDQFMKVCEVAAHGALPECTQNA